MLTYLTPLQNTIVHHRACLPVGFGVSSTDFTAEWSAGEKPSFPLFGWECRSAVEASLLPIDRDVSYTTVADYREELILTLSTARKTTLKSICEAKKV